MQVGGDGNGDASTWERAMLQLTTDAYASAWDRTTGVGGDIEREAGGRRNEPSIVFFDVAGWRSPSTSL